MRRFLSPKPKIFQKNMSKRKRVSGPPKRKRGNYASTALTTDAREVTARFFGTLLRRNFTALEATSIIHESGFDVPEKSLRDWNSKLQKGLPLYASEKRSGRKPLLSIAQTELVWGYVIDSNKNGKKASRQAVQKFISNTFQISPKRSTITNILDQGGFSSRQMALEGTAPTDPDDRLVSTYIDFIRQCRLDGRLQGEFWSLDCTYTGHRTEHEKGFAPIGGPRPKLGRKISRFTNCIVTMISSSGNQKWCVMFTYNPAFGSNPPRTKEQRESRAYAKRVARELGIAFNRIEYLGKEQKETRTYVAETPAIYESFLRYHVVPKSTIFSDAGNAFKRANVDVVAAQGYEHITYPPSIHQWLSPNDNMLHGEAKAKWRALEPDFEDDVRASLLLMKCLDDVPNEHIKGWFTKNFMIGVGNIAPAKVRPLISGPSYSRYAYLRACWHKYRKEVLGEQSPPPTVMHKLTTEFDGIYWNLE